MQVIARGIDQFDPDVFVVAFGDAPHEKALDSATCAGKN